MEFRFKIHSGRDYQGPFDGSTPDTSDAFLIASPLRRSRPSEILFTQGQFNGPHSVIKGLSSYCTFLGRISCNKKTLLGA